MPFGGKKAKGFNLDCVLGNVSITVVTCCGLVFQGTIVDDEHTRAQYGCPVVFPGMTMEFDKDDCKKDCKDEDKCEDKKDKKDHKKEIEVEVKCENEPKFICLKLDCQPGNICCPDDPSATGSAGFSFVTAIIGSASGRPPLFLVDDTVLISVDEIAAIGPSHTCLTPDD
ncbi:hypothetical protein SPSIL_050860 [Sporomusa silvacetica DSM 10669]|uniref:Spore coat protein Z n=1 Tax=Sporomusa silvacetica DSM 10669 TaxID=1123289 RepID=A0ABZ3ITW7_9FIRM|nr:hypothetical protein [Sporomusa silvacetica]OZC16604.1 hypothetical protein SPSIL_36980 [Sporomusa silvacetica DSM 10669]